MITTGEIIYEHADNITPQNHIPSHWLPFRQSLFPRLSFLSNPMRKLKIAVFDAGDEEPNWIKALTGHSRLKNFHDETAFVLDSWTEWYEPTVEDIFRKVLTVKGKRRFGNFFDQHYIPLLCIIRLIDISRLPCTKFPFQGFVSMESWWGWTRD